MEKKQKIKGSTGNEGKRNGKANEAARREWKGKRWRIEEKWKMGKGGLQRKGCEARGREREVKLSNKINYLLVCL